MYIRQHVILAICVLTSICAGFFVFYPIADGDIFWHLAAGREIVQNRALLFADPFSYTTPGIAWIDLHWLFQVISYLLFQISGYFGLLIFKAVVISLSVFFLMRPFKTYFGVITVSIILLFAIFQFRYLVPMRPGFLTLFFISLYIHILERCSNSFDVKYCIALIPLQVVWVNTQGLFIIGPVIYASYIAGWFTDYLYLRFFKNAQQMVRVKSKELFIFFGGFLAVVLSSLINPYGIKGLIFPLKLFERITPGEKNLFSNVIAENLPLLKMVGTEYQSYVITFVFLCTVALLSGLFASRGKKSAHVFLVIAFAILACMAQRNLILFVFAVIPYVKYNLESIRFSSLHAFIRYGSVLSGCIIFIIICFAVFSHKKMIDSVKGSIAPFCHPVKSTEYLESNSIGGKIFNADRYGGYLLWKMYPEYSVYIDTRLTMRDRNFFMHYLSLLDSPELFEKIITQYDITAIVLPASINRYFNLIRYLYNNPQWSLVIADGSECLFIRSNAVKEHNIRFDNGWVFNKILNETRLDSTLRTLDIKNEAERRLFNFAKVINTQ